MAASFQSIPEPAQSVTLSPMPGAPLIPVYFRVHKIVEENKLAVENRFVAHCHSVPASPAKIIIAGVTYQVRPIRKGDNTEEFIVAGHSTENGAFILAPVVNLDPMGVPSGTVVAFAGGYQSA